MPNRKSIDQEFSDSYNKKGLQPSTGQVSKIRDVQTEQGYDPNKRRGGVSTKAAGALGTNMQEVGVHMQHTGEQEGIRSVATEQYQNAGQHIGRTGKSLSLAAKRVRGHKKASAAGVAGKFVGRGVTLGIWSWGFFVWFWFQLPFTILSIVFMALAEAVFQLYDSLTVSTAADGILATALKYATQIIAAGLNTVLKILNFLMDKFLGFNLDTLNPSNLFMMTHVLVVLVGWGMLAAIGIIYTVTGQKAFSGKGAAAKNSLFILAFVGYAIPILNLFPWFFLWTLAVLKNPR
jgi:hypothetical protein